MWQTHILLFSNKLMQEERSGRHSVPIGSGNYPITDSNPNMSLVSAQIVHQDWMGLMRLTETARSPICCVIPADHTDYVTKC